MSFEAIPCSVCNKEVLILPDEDETRYWEYGKAPASEYWNCERREIYCGAECSLKRHIEVTDAT